LTIYVDSSFLVSLYLTDQHSPDARRRIQSAPPLWFTPLHNAEWEHAIAQHVFRKSLTADQGRKLSEQIRDERAAGLWRETDISATAWDLCADLARRHGPKLGVRTVDSLHVACALELKAERFWTFDERQANLAKSEGLRTS
jgi:predicted nucleic acid-binding protein